MEISRREFAEELRRQQEQMRRMFGGAIDPALLDTPESRVAVLEGLISQRLLAREERNWVYDSMPQVAKVMAMSARKTWMTRLFLVTRSNTRAFYPLS